MLTFLKRLFRRKPKQELPHCFDGGISRVDSNGKMLKRECLGHPGSPKCFHCKHSYAYSFNGGMFEQMESDEYLAIMHVVGSLVEGKKPEAWAKEILKPKKPMEDNP